MAICHSSRNFAQHCINLCEPLPATKTSFTKVKYSKTFSHAMNHVHTNYKIRKMTTTTIRARAKPHLRRMTTQSFSIYHLYFFLWSIHIFLLHFSFLFSLFSIYFTFTLLLAFTHAHILSMSIVFLHCCLYKKVSLSLAMRIWTPKWSVYAPKKSKNNNNKIQMQSIYYRKR